jgi:hypothetical protein
LPLSISLFRKRLRERKSGVTISSLRWASQESWRVLISSWRRVFCSGVRDATQAGLSKLSPFGGIVDEEVEEALGAPKKDVMDALTLGFLESDRAKEVALRLTGVVILHSFEDAGSFTDEVMTS